MSVIAQLKITLINQRNQWNSEYFIGTGFQVLGQRIKIIFASNHGALLVVPLVPMIPTPYLTIICLLCWLLFSFWGFIRCNLGGGTGSSKNVGMWIYELYSRRSKYGAGKGHITCPWGGEGGEEYILVAVMMRPQPEFGGTGLLHLWVLGHRNLYIRENEKADASVTPQ